MINRYFPVTRYPTDIPGLLYRPSIEPTYSDHADHIEPFHSLVTDHTTPDQYYSANNRRLLEKAIAELGLDKPGARGCILEIGVAIVTDDRPFENTSTYILTTKKANSVVYLGVDISEGKQVEADYDRNIHYLLGTSSFSRRAIKDEIPSLCAGARGIDLLHIDGDHSVTAVLNDWRYTEWLTPQGMAIFHDTNVHPGPGAVLDAVDRCIFIVEAFFTDRRGDFGQAVVRRVTEPADWRP